MGAGCCADGKGGEGRVEGGGGRFLGTATGAVSPVILAREGGMDLLRIQHVL
jgi:hypothetical protein